MTIRVLIADDHPIVRAGLAALFDSDGSITVVAAVGTTQDAILEGECARPDVVLMDLQFGGEFQGACATRQIRGLENAPAVLVLTNFDSESDIVAAIEAGAVGYLLKDAPPTEIIAAVHAAASGRSALAPAITTRLLTRVRQSHASLSVRELEVLGLVSEGNSNAAIAELLHLSETTVKSHLSHIYPKLGVSSRMGAVAAARSTGVLRAG